MSVVEFVTVANFYIERLDRGYTKALVLPVLKKLAEAVAELNELQLFLLKSTLE